MRITTQMLNAAMRKTGIPIRQSSLLDYLNKSENSYNPLLDSLQSKGVSANSRTKYKKQEKAADELVNQVQKFTEDDGKSIFDKIEGSQDKSEFCKEVDKFTEKYNSLLSALNTSPDSLDAFYRQSLKELPSSNKELLAEVGITASKDGKLKVDTEKMKKASTEKLQEALGKNSDFMEKVEFIASKVSDRAQANISSASSSYSRSGGMNYYSSNKYNFWG